MYNSKLKTQNSRLTGQALVELAIFGSILIFIFGVLIQYGLGQNYSQHLQMDSFRRALEANSQVHRFGNSVSYLLIEDLPMPDPADKFGFPRRSPRVANAGVTRSNDLMREPQFGNQSFLPRVFFRVGNTNQGVYQDKSFTTAGFAEVNRDPVSGIIYNPIGRWRKRVNVKDYMARGVSSWKWENIYFKGSHEEKMYYRDEDGKEQEVVEGMSADFDGDGEEERLVAVFIIEVVDDDAYDAIAGVGLIDYQEGEIDLTAELPDNQRQGYRGEYSSELSIEEASLRKVENSAGVTTTTTLTGRQTIGHRVWVNPRNLPPGAVYDPHSGRYYVEIENVYVTDEDKNF